MVEKGDDIQMCTFTQGLVDRGLEQGIEKGVKQGVLKEKQATIIRMLQLGMSDSDISKIAAISVSTIKKVRASQNNGFLLNANHRTVTFTGGCFLLDALAQLQ